MSKLSRLTTKLAIALVRLQAMDWYGGDIWSVTGAVLESTGETLAELLDDFFSQATHARRFLHAFEEADACFAAQIGDDTLVQAIRSMPLSGTSSWERMASHLPQTLDSIALTALIRHQFEADWLEHLTASQLDQAAFVYRQCLERALAVQFKDLVLPLLFNKVANLEATARRIENGQQEILMVGKKMQTEMEELKSQIKPDKSSSPGQDRQGLRVIVVDPQLRVRQNWIEHLDASATLSIVDEAGDLLPAMLNVHDLQPDILIVNASLLASHPNDIAIVHTIRYLCPRTKIALIVKDRRERDYASSLGVDDALPASLDLDKISGLLEGLSKDHRRMGKFLRQQLDELPPGPHHAYQFENLLKEILQFVLSPDFAPAPRITNLWLHASPVSQLTFYYQQKREISFWRDLQRASGFNQIVVQLQNSHYILEGSLSSLSLHLNSARRSFGLVISRNPPRQSLFQEQSVLNVNGKIVLVLWDEHIKILLSLVAAGVKTDFFFRDMLVKLQQGGKPNMTDITPVRGRM